MKQKKYIIYKYMVKPNISKYHNYSNIIFVLHIYKIQVYLNFNSLKYFEEK